MSESDQVETYIQGLRNAIARDVDMKDPRTLQEAMLYAARVEILLDNRQRRNNLSSYRQSSYLNPYASSTVPAVPSASSSPMELGNASLAAAEVAEPADDELDGVDWDAEYQR